MHRFQLSFTILLISLLFSSSASMAQQGTELQQIETVDPYTTKRKIRGAEILATKAVDVAYVDIAEQIYRHMTSRTDPVDIPAIHETSEFKIILIGDGDRFSDLPHYQGQGRMIDRAAGLGGQIGEFYIGVRVGIPHALVHEIGHGIYHSGIQFDETGGESDLEKWHNERTQAKYKMDFEDAVNKHGQDLIHEVLLAPENTFSSRLANAWKNAQIKKLWSGTYAGSEPNEYWAEGVTMWFRAYSDIEGDSREYLRKQDSKLYELCRSIFPETDWKPADAVEAAKADVRFDNFHDGDQEGDGRSEEQIKDEIEEILSELDRNGDGKIQLTEVPDDMREDVEQADTNEDGHISREELARAVEEMNGEKRGEQDGRDRRSQKQLESDVDEHFRELDSNDNGKIERAEVPKQLLGRFDAVDTDKNKVVTRDELIRSLDAENAGQESIGRESDRDDEQEDGEDDIDEMFSQLDRNEDGKLQRKEVPTENHADFDAADANENGVVSLDELRAALSQDEVHDNDEDESEFNVTDEINVTLRELDTNEDGKIQKTEVPTQLLSRFEKVDSNGDEVVTVDELRDSLASDPNEHDKSSPETGQRQEKRHF